MVKPFTDCSIGAEWGAYFNLFFDRNGVLYLPFAANDPALKTANRPVDTEDERDYIPRNVYLARSDDSGRTFTTATVFRVEQGHPDLYNKGVVGAVDPKDPSHVYVGWRQGGFSSKTQKLKNPVAASSDGGRTFSPPVDITDELGADHPWLAVGRDGTVHAVTWSRTFNLPDPTPPRPIYHSRSTDHGKTWERHEIDPGNDRSYRPPVLVADPTSDSLYAVWFGSATLKNSELKDADRTDIFLRASHDGGRTWSERRVINDDAGRGVNHTFPGIAVAPNGRVDVAWYDGRLSPVPAGDPEDDRGFTDIFASSSTDGGRTWTRNVRISDRSSDRSIGVWSNNIGSAGPVGVASTDEAVFFAWQDTRNGNAITQSEDVYTAALQLGDVETVGSSSDRPGWLFLLGGTALGMGIAMVLAWVVASRSGGGRARGATA